MTQLVLINLIGWIPATVVFFLIWPARRAVIVAAIAAWLFLPVAGISLPGVPDISKSSAPIYGIVLSMFLIDRGRLSRFRFRWIDLPTIVWCLVPLASSLSNDLGPYDGFSATLIQTTTWGLPYFLGRLYLGDLAGLHALAVGIVVGGLAYVPLCLFEIAMSPKLHMTVYGFAPTILAFAKRFGGYRPVVFMSNGLELGMWMTVASLLGCSLWSSGGLKRLGGMPLGTFALPLLVGTTVLCKSTGALLLLAVGLAILATIRRTRWRFPVCALLLLPILYEGSRVTGIWDGRSAVAFAQTTINQDRATSLEVRLENEDILIAKALQRPVVGWGGWGRSRIYDEDGRDICLTDGLWVIALGSNGLVGLAALTGMLLAPAVAFARWPVRCWTAPQFTHAAAFTVILGLYMIDSLSNAMYNPIYVLAAGGVAGMASIRPPRNTEDEATAPGDDLSAGGEPFQRALEIDGRSCRRRGRARGEASAPAVSVSLAEREEAWRLAVESLNDDRASHAPGWDRRPYLALAYERWAHTLALLGRPAEAVIARESALALRAALGAEKPHDPDAMRRWADSLNDLAWLLVVASDPAREVAARDAMRRARQAVRMFPGEPAYWNTLGAAYCRLRDWPLMAQALGRSTALGGGTNLDHLLCAIAHCERGDLARARRSYQAALHGLSAGEAGHPDFVALKAEAESLIERSARNEHCDV